eukprot:3707671-Rhodomonas_salina.1
MGTGAGEGCGERSVSEGVCGGAERESVLPEGAELQDASLQHVRACALRRARPRHRRQGRAP